MRVAEQPRTLAGDGTGRQDEPCYHCGTPCSGPVSPGGKPFCCDGCRLVFELLEENGLCNYYELQDHPGLRHIRALRKEKFAFLDDEAIAARLHTFTSRERNIVRLYIPGIHCSSCMWLLEHLRRLDDGILESRLDFGAKELTVQYVPGRSSLRTLVELLATIGYEPNISLDDADGKRSLRPGRLRLYRLGVAGFCFANIMMMSFPEYLAGKAFELRYASLLHGLNLLLALPVFFFSAGEFFSAAWKGIRARTLNIDAPIALAVLITFCRSLYEILGHTGAGYLDSMSGIVFFMLAGRLVQERTYRSISFHRDYRSYFPVAVTVLRDGREQACSLDQLSAGDVVQLYNDELIPADGIVAEGEGAIDYSFVTGESRPVRVQRGERVYAGGRQTGERLVVAVQQPVAASYLTSLWHHNAFRKKKQTIAAAESRIHVLSRYFTLILFVLAAATGIYWAVNDPSRTWNSVTAMLIVACPCALLLSATFTNGNLLRIFSRSGLFLRDAGVIEQMSAIDFIAFDKTGTLSSGAELVQCAGLPLNPYEAGLVCSVVRSSRHPYSIALAQHLAAPAWHRATDWKETPGRGITAIVDGTEVRVGNAALTGVRAPAANVCVRIGSEAYGFIVRPHFRAGVAAMLQTLRQKFLLALLSGDRPQERQMLRSMFGSRSELLFRQRPADKLAYIERMQQYGHKVLMIGDGLNDAGALQQSNVGITLADDVNNFTPACDAVLDAERFDRLPAFLRMARTGAAIINVSFAISLVYNIAGLYFAVQGLLRPMIAAILMPLSTLTIVLLSTGLSSLAARWLGLRSKT